MSWDILVYTAKEEPLPVAQLPDSWRGEVIGSRGDIRAKISACLSDVDWSDLIWGRYYGNGFTFEFNLGGEDPCYSFMIHVRRGGDPIKRLSQIAHECGWYLMDTPQGEWFHRCLNPGVGWERFKEYRDYVMDDDFEDQEK